MCGKHFTQDCFDTSARSKGRVRKKAKLKDNAIPTLFLHPEESGEIPNLIKPKILRDDQLIQPNLTVRFIGAKPDDQDEPWLQNISGVGMVP